MVWFVVVRCVVGNPRGCCVTDQNGKVWVEGPSWIGLRSRLVLGLDWIPGLNWDMDGGFIGLDFGLATVVLGTGGFHEVVLTFERQGCQLPFT